MNWFLAKPKCQACGNKFKTNEKPSELRLDTSEGIITMEICAACSYVLDKTSDILHKKKSIGQENKDD